MTQLLDTVMAVEFSLCDDPESLSRGALAAPSVLRIVDRALDTLRAVNAHFEALSAPDEGRGRGGSEPSLEHIGAQISAEIAAREIADLSFVAAGDLRYHRRRLESALAAGGVSLIVAAADAALHRMRRTLIPLESALCDFTGVRQPLRIWPDLEVSVQVRHAYTRLIRDVAVIAEPPAEELASCLTRVADSFAVLRRNPIYPSLRIADRLHLGDLCQRIAAWLVQPERLGPNVGRDLLADARAFVGLLRQVNQRAELRKHDRELAERSYHRLLTAGPLDVPPGMLDELESLYGRDPEIDALITEGRRQSVDWIPLLRRLLGELAV